jgi:hypothetical protein
MGLLASNILFKALLDDFLFSRVIKGHMDEGFAHSFDFSAGKTCFQACAGIFAVQCAANGSTAYTLT